MFGFDDSSGPFVFLFFNVFVVVVFFCLLEHAFAAAVRSGPK